MRFAWASSVGQRGCKGRASLARLMARPPAKKAVPRTAYPCEAHTKRIADLTKHCTFGRDCWANSEAEASGQSAVPMPKTPSPPRSPATHSLSPL